MAMRYTRSTLVLLLLAITCALMFVPAASACPGCKEAVAASEDENGTPEQSFSSIGAAYSYSVLFMLGMLFTMLLGFGGAFYRLYRKQARLNQAAQLPSDGSRKL